MLLLVITGPRSFLLKEVNPHPPVVSVVGRPSFQPGRLESPPGSRPGSPVLPKNLVHHLSHVSTLGFPTRPMGGPSPGPTRLCPQPASAHLLVLETDDISLRTL